MSTHDCFKHCEIMQLSRPKSVECTDKKHRKEADTFSHSTAELFTQGFALLFFYINLIADLDS